MSGGLLHMALAKGDVASFTVTTAAPESVRAEVMFSITRSVGWGFSVWRESVSLSDGHQQIRDTQ
jgi:hypothetical protein